MQTPKFGPMNLSANLRKPSYFTKDTTMAIDLPEIRANRTLPRGARLFKKIPAGKDSFGVDEENVVFGLGKVIAAGAGSAVLSQNVPRSCLLRDLIISHTAAGRVTAITINGKAHLIGSSVPFSAFGATTQNRPEFNVYVEGGTVVSVNIEVDAAGTIDAAFNID